MVSGTTASQVKAELIEALDALIATPRPEPVDMAIADHELILPSRDGRYINEEVVES